jgi:putative sigma-54 modulation protein
MERDGRPEEDLMQLQIKGKNLDVSDSIRSYAERKLAKLDRMVNDGARIEIELAVEKNPSVADNQVAEATVRLKGHTLRAREASRDMKASIDELTEKLLRQVREEREKKSSKRRTADKHLNGDTAVE